MQAHSHFCAKHPDPEVILRLEPEELAGVLLELWRGSNESDFIRRDLYLHEGIVEDYEYRFREPVLRLISTAWGWLEREGLIALLPTPHGPTTNYFVTIRGEKIKSKIDFDNFRLAASLPVQILHPKIAESVVPTFMRGKFDTAVFEAFREVEVAVRTAAKASERDLGVPLMRKAFDKTSGPLTDMTTLDAEREALSNLFAGAIGSYKNPHSHRHVELEPGEAAEMILLASHLLKIVEARAPKT